jgi:hypothetical protein
MADQSAEMSGPGKKHASDDDAGEKSPTLNRGRRFVSRAALETDQAQHTDQDKYDKGSVSQESMGFNIVSFGGWVTRHQAFVRRRPTEKGYGGSEGRSE